MSTSFRGRPMAVPFFLARSTPQAIHDRARAMLERSRDRGGYALGSGNSIPDYIPPINYLTMIDEALR